MTIQQIKEIAAEQGLGHARFCAEQEATQVGRDSMREVFDYLARMEAAQARADEAAAIAAWNDRDVSE